MKNIPSIDKISNFRDLINSNSSFVRKEYGNKDGKNFWNIVCSCMDWITVAIKYLKSIDELDEDLDIKAMQVYSIISSVDLVFESICQLHRVFINNKTMPFVGEKGCFANPLFDKSDNEYFKEIRAAFGAHPVNLNGDGEKRFASWPYHDFMKDDDFTVTLYSNKVGINDLHMSLKISELIYFLNRNYNYLDVISEKVKFLYETKVDELRKEKIEMSSNSLEQLFVLEKESKKRFNDDYYNGVINELLTIFGCDHRHDSIKEEVSEFRESLKPLIKELRKKLQAAQIKDLKNESLLSSNSELTGMLSYEVSKFYSWLAGNESDHLIDYYLRRFNEVSEFKYNFSIKDFDCCLLLKLNLMLRQGDLGANHIE